MNRPWLALLVVALLVAACSGASVAPPSPATLPAVAASPEVTDPPESEEADPTEEASEDPPAEPSEAAGAGPDQYEAGDTVVVSKADVDQVEITVTGVQSVETYDGEYVDDQPQVDGNVFIQAFVEYVALADDVSYNALDWNAFSDGAEIDTFTFVLNGPEPALGSGTLATGGSASGWLVYEVPAEGEVVLSYGDIIALEDGPVFEVFIR